MLHFRRIRAGLGLIGQRLTGDLSSSSWRGRTGSTFDCVIPLHRVRQMPKEDFKKALAKELTSKRIRQKELGFF